MIETHPVLQNLVHILVKLEKNAVILGGSPHLLLMAEILHHLGCIKPYK